MTTNIKTEETADELKAQFEDQYARGGQTMAEEAQDPETCWITSC